MTKRKSNNANKRSNNNPNGLNRVRRSGKISVPAAMGGVISKQDSTLPLQAGIGRKMIVQNYELVTAFPTQDAVAAYKKLAITANPGILGAFPWLSTVALSYSKFNWKFLRFMYVPQVATSTAGVVFINAMYDAADTQPPTLASVAQSSNSSIGPAWQGGGINAEKAFRADLGIDEMIFIDVDCKAWTQPYFYVRKQAGTDADTKPCVIVYGNDASVPALLTPGSLYVAYICELLEPVDSSTQA